MTRFRWATRHKRALIIGCLLLGCVLPTIWTSAFVEFLRLGRHFPGDVLRNGDAFVSSVYDYKLQQMEHVATINKYATRMPRRERRANDVVDLYIPGHAFDALQQDLPESGTRYQRASIWRDGNIEKVRVRYRGNSGGHWLYDRKSLKIKTAKSRLLRGHRHINLTAKAPFWASWLHAIGREFDLLVPDTAPVQIYVNNQFYGVMRFLEEVDEGFLRRRALLPGRIYEGESHMATNEFRYGARMFALWRNPELWQLNAIENAATDSYRGDLEEVTAAVAEPHVQALTELFARIDRQTAARHLAYKLLLGEWHQGNLHNQKWYANPATGRWQPVLWDVYLSSNSDIFPEAGRGESNPPHYQPVPEIYHALGRDPTFMQAVFAEMWSRASRPTAIRGHWERLDLALARQEDALRAQPNNPAYVEDRESFRAGWSMFENNCRRVLSYLDSGGVYVALANEQLVLGTTVPGGAHINRCVVTAPIEATTQPWLRDKDHSGTASEVDTPLQLSWRPLGENRYEVVFLEPLTVLPGLIGRYRTRPIPLPHGLIIPKNVRVEQLEATHGITGAAVGVAATTSWPRYDGDAIHPWDIAQPSRPQTHRLPAGRYHLREDWEIGAESTVILSPGTELLLDPAVSIIAKGRVIAEGTPSAPIRVKGTGEAPWGAFVLQGAGASGSRFTHVQFANGSLLQHDNVWYPGMVSIHNARSVHFENCTFSGSTGGDDALRAAQSEVSIVRCHFADVASDAVDFDMTDGLIQHSTFERIGNDAIDLMHSAPRIIGNTMTDCGDKGVSIGEDSQPLVFNCRLQRCDIGIQIKDLSDPLLLNLEIEECRVGIDASKKNWRYGAGGRGEVWNSLLRKNATAVAVDKDSELRIHSSHIMGGEQDISSKRLAVHNPVLDDTQVPPESLEAYASFEPIKWEPRIGRVDRSAGLTPKTVILDDRFMDGFALNGNGWKLTDSENPLYVERRALSGRINRAKGAYLIRELAEQALRPGDTLVLTWSTAERSNVSLEAGRTSLADGIFDTVATEELGPIRRTTSISYAGTEAKAIRFVTPTPTVLRIHDLQVLRSKS